MTVSWGYSPKIEKYIPLNNFPADKYLIIARQAVINLGWKLSHISSTGLIAYTPLSLPSYSEEIAIRIAGNFVLAKSECIGIQLCFTDYGKNAENLDRFFNEFEYVEYHLEAIWEESLQKFHEFVNDQDDNYFEKAPLTAKNKIKNILYLFYPRQGYFVTPIIINLNILYWIFSIVLISWNIRSPLPDDDFTDVMENIFLKLGVNDRELVLNGQYWRLISHQFIHFSILHLFFNLYTLVYIGLMVEHKLGSKKYLVIYILSGVCGGLVSLIFHKLAIMAGASGAIMGLFGAFLALLHSHAFEKNANKAMLISTLLVTALMLLSGISGDTDNSAHIGGLVSGYVICYILFNEQHFQKKVSTKRRYTFVAVITLIFTAAVLLRTPNYQLKTFRKLQYSFDINAADFEQVYNIPDELSKAEKIKHIYKYGISAWQKNLQIVKQMQALKLDDQHQYRLNFDARIATKALRISQLFKQEYAEGTNRYRTEMNSLAEEINKIRLEAGKSEYAW